MRLIELVRFAVAVIVFVVEDDCITISKQAAGDLAGAVKVCFRLHFEDDVLAFFFF